MDQSVGSEVEFRDPLVGRVLQERYRVLRELGRGGMGVVYLGEHVLIKRRVAIKMLQPMLTSSEEAFHRFQREARAAAAVGNQHVVDVTDMGRLDDGSYYMVLEYLDGIDLAELVANEGPLPVERAANIAMQILDGLTDVHATGIVHRDLKPENIFLIQRAGRRDFVKILDFGICKVLNERALTETGIALGTPRFMSPEQLEARPETDQRADVYAVGAILFFALTGRGPFDGVSLPELLVSIWQEPAPRLRDARPDASPELESIITRALEKDPARRFAGSRAMHERMKELFPQLVAVSTSTGAELKPAASDSRDKSRARTSPSKPVERPTPISRMRFERSARTRALTVFAIIAGVGALSGILYLFTETIGTTPPHRAKRAAAPVSETSQAQAGTIPEPQPNTAIEPPTVEANAAPRTAAIPTQRRTLPQRRKNRPPSAASTPEASVAPSADRAVDAAPNPETAPKSPAAPADPAPSRLVRDAIVPPPAALKRVFGPPVEQ